MAKRAHMILVTGATGVRGDLVAQLSQPNQIVRALVRNREQSVPRAVDIVTGDPHA